MEKSFCLTLLTVSDVRKLMEAFKVLRLFIIGQEELGKLDIVLLEFSEVAHACTNSIQFRQLREVALP